MEENEQTSQEETEVREDDEELRELFQAQEGNDGRKKTYWGKIKTDESKTKCRNKTESQQDHGQPPKR